MESNCNIFFTSLEENAFNDLFDHYLATLPEALQNRLGKYPKLKDRYLSIAGKLLLAKALGIYGFDEVDAFEHFRYSDKGRPYIEGIDIDFNISHSGNLVVCAFSKRDKVGIDIQKKITLTRTQANLYYNLIEDTGETGCPEDLKVDYVLEVWTRKEAVSKLLGDGLSIAFSKVLIHKDSYKTADQTIYLYNVPVQEGYICTLASSNKLECPTLIKVELQDLFQSELINVKHNL